MSKNNGFGKFLLFCATVAAAGAGVYYYLSKRDAAIADEFDDDDFDDFEDFEDDDNETPEVKFGSRKYVDIKSSDSDDKENAGAETKSDSASKDSDGELDEEDTSSKEPSASKSEEFFNDEK